MVLDRKLLSLLVSITLIFLLQLFLYDNTYSRTKSIPSSFEDSLPKTIPFDLNDGLIFIQVKINNSKPLPFVLDTGAATTVINKAIVDELKLPLSNDPNIEVMGIGDANATATFLKSVKFNLSDREVVAEYPVTVDLTELSYAQGQSIAGILGAEVFFRYVVEIDYSSQTIILYEPKSYSYKGKGENLSLKFSKDVANLSFVEASIEILGFKSLKATYLIDTGNNGTVTLKTPFVEKNKLLAGKQKLVETKVFGINGETSSFKGIGQNFQIGQFKVTNPVIILNQSQKERGEKQPYDGLIGNEMLKRFKVVFDYQHKRMFLEKGYNFDLPFEINMSGLGIIAQGNNFKKFKIQVISQSSVALEAGLKVGDEIIAIDDSPASSLTLSQIRQMFKQKGKEYLLKIKREDKILQFKLKMENPFL